MSTTVPDQELKARHRLMWASGDYAYGPTIATMANARRDGREAELESALADFCRDWNRGTGDAARFEAEYLVAVGTRS